MNYSKIWLGEGLEEVFSLSRLLVFMPKRFIDAIEALNPVCPSGSSVTTSSLTFPQQKARLSVQDDTPQEGSCNERALRSFGFPVVALPTRKIDRTAAKCKLLPVDFRRLENSSEVIISDLLIDTPCHYVRQCLHCAVCQPMPLCRTCEGNQFGIFRISGIQHGIFCKHCSLGQAHWDCPSCNLSNPYDQTVKQLIKAEDLALAAQKSTAELHSSLPIWNRLIFLSLFAAIIIYRLIGHD